MDHEVHDNPAIHAEHMAALKLIGEPTHVAVMDGDMADTQTWGGMPLHDEAAVLIPEGRKVDATTGHVIRDIRVDGQFAMWGGSLLLAQTAVSTGSWLMGTEQSPIPVNETAKLLFRTDRDIDVRRDPMLLGTGLISLGKFRAHGSAKTPHLKIATMPMAGDEVLQLSSEPKGWLPGDELLIAGTTYLGHGFPTYDEVVTLVEVRGKEVRFTPALKFDHSTPRPDLRVSMGNLTRNVVIASEDPNCPIHRRGHTMFMHTDDADVRYAAFEDLGRTDKSQPTFNASQFMPQPETCPKTGQDLCRCDENKDGVEDHILPDSNIRGRYSFHFHRAGDETTNPALAQGVVVRNSPGWGLVHHDSHADFIDSISFNVLGAGFVAESGNETGIWRGNLAVGGEGAEAGPTRGVNKASTFDTGRSGSGFFFQGRMVESEDNIAASVNCGFVYFHRGSLADNAQLQFDASRSGFPEDLDLSTSVAPDDVPIRHFKANECFGSTKGIQVVKADPKQGHDIMSVLADLKAWHVLEGGAFEYTSHYLIKNMEVIATPGQRPFAGVMVGQHTNDVVFPNLKVSGFRNAVFMEDKRVFTPHIFIDPEFIDCDVDFTSRDGSRLEEVRKVVSSSIIVPGRFDLALEPVFFREGKHDDPTANRVTLKGVKTDSLGELPVPVQEGDYVFSATAMRTLLARDGYWTRENGQRVVLLPRRWSDRTTGDLIEIVHEVELDVSDLSLRIWKAIDAGPLVEPVEPTEPVGPPDPVEPVDPPDPVEPPAERAIVLIEGMQDALDELRALHS